MEENMALLRGERAAPDDELVVVDRGDPAS
jgi:hypothetical protein